MHLCHNRLSQQHALLRLLGALLIERGKAHTVSWLMRRSDSPSSSRGRASDTFMLRFSVLVRPPEMALFTLNPPLIPYLRKIGGTFYKGAQGPRQLFTVFFAVTLSCCPFHILLIAGSSMSCTEVTWHNKELDVQDGFRGHAPAQVPRQIKYGMLWYDALGDSQGGMVVAAGGRGGGGEVNSPCI